MKINRILQKTIETNIDSGKIIIIYGPRQVGKTTLARDILSVFSNKKILEISADERRFREILFSQDSVKLKSLIGNADLVFIDEAQRVSDIGLSLKIIHDQMPDVKLIVTGSSSFDLANKTKESLTGRTFTFTLYPLAMSELKSHYNDIDLDSMLENILVYGLYPDIFTSPDNNQKELRLKELCRSYVYSDVLNFSGIKNPGKIEDLLRLLAFQTGSEVNMTELGAQLGMSKDTINKYISILENAFIIFRLSGFSSNLRNEITKMHKIYFYDNGIRNMIIEDTRPVAFRNDTGQLWENFLMAERRKVIEYFGVKARGYFWRTYSQVEIDYIEQSNDALKAFEFKYSPNKKSRVPSAWKDAYPGSEFSVITVENYRDFVLFT